MRISDWSSDVCSSDLLAVENDEAEQQRVIEYLALSNWASQAAYGAVMANKKAASLRLPLQRLMAALKTQTEAILSLVEADRTYFDELSVQLDERFERRLGMAKTIRSEEHTSELQSLMRTSYAAFCLKKKKRST